MWEEVSGIVCRNIYIEWASCVFCYTLPSVLWISYNSTVINIIVNRSSPIPNEVSGHEIGLRKSCCIVSRSSSKVSEHREWVKLKSLKSGYFHLKGLTAVKNNEQTSIGSRQPNYISKQPGNPRRDYCEQWTILGLLRNFLRLMYLLLFLMYFNNQDRYIFN
jgi:hypothetical protein